MAAFAVVQASGAWLQPIWVAGPTEGAPTVVLMGGLKGPDDSGAAIERAVKIVEKMAQKQRPFNLYAIPAANPDAADLAFPPTGTAYRENGQSHFIWRWLGVHAPDLVLVV